MGSYDGRMSAQTLDYHTFVGIQYISILYAQKRIYARTRPTNESTLAFKRI